MPPDHRPAAATAVRACGATWRAVAETTGYSTRTDARRAVQRHLDGRERQARAELAEVDRLRTQITGTRSGR